MRNTRNKILLTIAISILVSSIMVHPVFAELPPIVPEGCSGANSTASSCTVTELIQLAINVSEWVLGLLGSVALLMFVYGGFTWITAAGRSAQIESGRNIIVGAVIGIVITLGAYTGVEFLGKSLGGDELGSEFGEFIDSGTTNVCKKEGDPCTFTVDGRTQRVYACNAFGSCSGVSLCEFWSKRPASDFGGPGYACRQKSNCDPAFIKTNLCPGDANNVCCKLP